MYNFNQHIVNEPLNEYGGSERKRTIMLDDGKKYLLKFPDPTREKHVEMSYINNAFSEYIACKILKSMGFQVQDVILGEYTDERGITKIACACQDIRQLGDTLHEIEKIELGSLDDLTGRAISFEKMDRIFEHIPGISRQELSDFYYDLFIADAFIGNTDRHNGNWGVISNMFGNTIAPIFDCGSSLNPLLSDEDLSSVSYDQVALSTDSVLLRNDMSAKIRYYDFFMESDDDRVYQALRRVLPKIHFDEINEIIDRTDYISDIRKDFYKSTLSIRYERMLLPALERFCTRGIAFSDKNENLDYYQAYKNNLSGLRNAGYMQAVCRQTSH